MSSFFRRSTPPSTPSSSLTSITAIKTVLPTPTLKVTPTRPALPEGEHLELYNQLLAHVSKAGYSLPVGENKMELRALAKGEKMWLTEDCLLRYLRAQKWDLASATTKLEVTLIWRRENGLADDDGGEGEGGGLTAALIKSEGRCGKDYCNGWDETGRPLHYQVPSRNESTDSALNVKYCVWVMERSIDLMPPGIEKQVLLVNFAGGMSPPPIATVRGWISMLSHHYPERMGKAIAINVPWILNAFFKIILPLIDPITRAKLSFNEAAPWVPDDQLETAYGGKFEFQYDQEIYSPSLTALCAERRKSYRARWEADGARIGASEWVLRGGDELFPQAQSVERQEPSIGNAETDPIVIPQK
ncbi:Phosphatidylinositol transfer protein PDR16 and related proteins [Phaffia rhodozyma]|uniref:Phosphatidylinositol transfer protein PDR16 and related proteins n=1 Tax=Phaffia rhodozyma TaxID=264483 RepID=A0A0F7SJY5_PHARH|nr:Phosphatidylinositol transfer protein PDR16 and related proteins [Phaffia rhodozyma]